MIKNLDQLNYNFLTQDKTCTKLEKKPVDFLKKISQNIFLSFKKIGISTGQSSRVVTWVLSYIHSHVEF
jgi:hypothetical protein